MAVDNSDVEGVVPQLVDGDGLAWNELSDMPFLITPTLVGMHTVITDWVVKRLGEMKAELESGGLLR